MMCVSEDRSLSEAMNIRDKEKELNEWYKDIKKNDVYTQEVDSIFIIQSVK